MSYRKVAVSTAKLALGGLIIAGIAAVFVVVSEDGDVTEARADLVDLHPAQVAEHQDFERVMKEAGFRPRPYDHNGNSVNFAAADSPLPPLQLQEVIQQRLQHAGINSRVYNNSLAELTGDQFEELSNIDPDDAEPHQLPEEVLEMYTALLNGEVIPVMNHAEHVLLAGLQLEKDLDEIEELVGEEWKAQLHDEMENEDIMRLIDESVPHHKLPMAEDFADKMTGYRFIEAYKDDSSPAESTAVASWSDPGEFDGSQMYEPEGLERRTDLEVPACIGCTRTNRLAALDDEEPYVLNQFEARSTPSNITAFYDDELRRRHWEPTEREQVLDEFTRYSPQLRELQNEGQMRSYRRGEQSLLVFMQHANSPASETEVLTLMEERPPAGP